MKQLDHFPEYTKQVLSGLTADESLKNRILMKAAGDTGAERAFSRLFLRSVPYLAAAACLVLCFGILFLGMQKPLSSQNEPGDIHVFTAGQQDPVVAGNETDSIQFGAIDPGDVVALSWSDIGEISDPEKCRKLAETLLASSVSADAAEEEFNATLTVKTADGKTMRYAVSEPYLWNNGCWDCRVFFDMFREYAE